MDRGEKARVGPVFLRQLLELLAGNIFELVEKKLLRKTVDSRMEDHVRERNGGCGRVIDAVVSRVEERDQGMDNSWMMIAQVDGRRLALLGMSC